MQQKDVIYIDVEDDITAIIDKVKDSSEKVVALVPPKRVGVLQSAVNLRLLSRAAKNSDKQLALVTSNMALGSLAAAASIPVAKNLQSKPELGEIAVLDVDDGDDVIDGSELPVGDHAGVPVVDNDLVDEPKKAEEKPKKLAAKKDKSKKGTPAVPNFNKFRKKLILIIIAIIGLIALLVWAIVFAPSAKIIVSAKTDDSSVNQQVTLSSKASTDADKNTIKAAIQQQSDDKSVGFNASGRKNVGKKASGDVSFTKSTRGSATISAGSTLKTSGGLSFVVDSDVTVPGASLSFDCDGYLCPGKASGSVTASEKGAKYNAASGSLSGAPDGVSTRLKDATSGGTDKIAKIVTEGDVQDAKQELVDDNTDEIKDSLKAKFGESVVVIDQSFATKFGDVSISPGVGEESDSGKATLKAKVSYSLYGVERSEIGDFTKELLKDTVIEDEDQQRVYDDGADKASFQDEQKSSNGATATLIATAKIGPQIDEKQVKEDSRGKKYGEIQSKLQEIDGIDKVNVNFFPFWVNKVPDDVKRVTIEFKVDES